MRAIKNANLLTPEFYLSDDLKMFIMKRFDIDEDGSYLGFEDMCVLTAIGTQLKYDGSYEEVARVIKDIISPQKRKESLKILFKALIMNHLLKNGDGHLKNYGILFQTNENLKLIKPNYEAEAQDLFVFNKKREDKGSFRYLITSQPYMPKEEKEDADNELDTIVEFVSEICHNKRSEYAHISELIANKQKAIAIIFDSSTKMLELKQKLRAKGVTAKVSASDNFYYTKEVNDIFNTLKALDLLSKNPMQLNDTQKYYVVGAMRSNILRIDDNAIKKYLDSNTLPEKIREYIEVLESRTLSQLVKFIYDDSNIFGVYAHFDDVEQRVANLYKFLTLCKDYESSSESSVYKFLSLIENAIYFSEAKEDEAFFKSDNTKSIEICSIHSTKGLAYPLVLLANSDKGLYSQITSDALKHNNFTLSDEKKEIVGFKINGYEPLSMRVLKQMDKLKHLAEKKRLLYVALTRAEHHVVISAQLKETSKGAISLREDSYLSMIIDSLGITKEELYEQDARYCLDVQTNNKAEVTKQTPIYVEHSFAPLEFEAKEITSATNSTTTHDDTAAKLGTITHKIFELYWSVLESVKMENIFRKFNIYDEMHKKQIQNSVEKFLKSDIYTRLKMGTEHKFELEFNTQDKRGYIDLIYFDESKNDWVIVDFKTGTPSKELGYQEQLEFYESVLVESGLSVVGKGLLWV